MKFNQLPQSWKIIFYFHFILAVFTIGMIELPFKSSYVKEYEEKHSRGNVEC